MSILIEPLLEVKIFIWILRAEVQVVTEVLNRSTIGSSLLNAINILGVEVMFQVMRVSTWGRARVMMP